MQANFKPRCTEERKDLFANKGLLHIVNGIKNGSAQIYLIRKQMLLSGARTYIRRLFPHENSGERQTTDMDGALEALRDIWSLQAPERISAANHP